MRTELAVDETTSIDGPNQRRVETAEVALLGSVRDAITAERSKLAIGRTAAVAAIIDPIVALFTG
jgi:hypothetical protein